MIKLLGISGYARSGKDTFVQFAQKILKENSIMAPRVAFADELKKNLNTFLMNNMGISAFTRDDNQKKIIRPMLIGYGHGMRQLNPDHWIETIRPNILGAISTTVNIGEHNNYIFPIISDVRYVNEAKFVQEMGGKVIVVSRKEIPAPNETEAESQPLVNEIADYILDWPTFGLDELDKAEPLVEKCLKELGVI